MGVFVSYSRRNKPFVQKLVKALPDAGLEAWGDFEDIRLTSDCQAEVYEGIRTSDHFLFVISPPAVTSTYTEREVMHAVEHSKKIVPVLYAPISEEEYANMNPALAVQDWVYFDDESQFEDAFRRLLVFMEYCAAEDNRLVALDNAAAARSRPDVYAQPHAAVRPPLLACFSGMC